MINKILCIDYKPQCDYLVPKVKSLKSSRKYDGREQSDKKLMRWQRFEEEEKGVGNAEREKEKEIEREGR